jgi:hypothetical protein
MRYYSLIVNFFYFILFNIYLSNKFILCKNNNYFFSYLYVFQCYLNLINSTNIFIGNLISLNFFNAFFRVLLKSLKYFAYGFMKFFFFLIIGLGFKKKTSRFNFFYIFVGNRHWVRFNFCNNNLFFNIRKRNIIFFVETKQNLHYYLAVTKNMRKETAFKTKGIMFSRV